MEDYEDYEDDLEGFEDSERSRTRFDLFAGKSLSLARATFHIPNRLVFLPFLDRHVFLLFRQNKANYPRYFRSSNFRYKEYMAEIESSGWSTTLALAREEETWLR